MKSAVISNVGKSMYAPEKAEYLSWFLELLDQTYQRYQEGGLTREETEKLAHSRLDEFLTKLLEN